MAAKLEYPLLYRATITMAGQVNCRRTLLAVRSREDRSGWYVEAWWTNRPSEDIGHFATQSEARNWKTLESTSYFVLREIESMINHPHQAPS
jgi:hypothetical protein